MKYLFILFFPVQLLAQGAFDLPHEEIYPDAEDILIRNREKYLFNESMIYDLNTEYGIKDQRSYTGSDHNRISFAGHVNGSYEYPSNLVGGEIAYMRRTDRYHRLWWGIQAFAHSTFFRTLTDNPTTGSDAQFNRDKTVRNNIWGAGPGIGYRFKFLQDLLDLDDVFETVDVFANFLQLDERSIKRSYRGYGLSTNFGVHKRSGTSFFWGGKFSYNVGTVTREALAEESRDERSLSVGWLSYALEFGFLF